MTREEKMQSLLNKIRKVIEESGLLEDFDDLELVPITYLKEELLKMCEPGENLFLHPSEIAEELLKYNPAITEVDVLKLSKTLKSSGFIVGVKKVKGRPVRGYYLSLKK